MTRDAKRYDGQRLFVGAGQISSNETGNAQRLLCGLVQISQYAGKLQRSDEFVMSVNAWRRGGAPSGTSAMMVPVNTKTRLDELLQGIIVQSGNDASICVAEGIAGNEDKPAPLGGFPGLPG